MYGFIRPLSRHKTIEKRLVVSVTSKTHTLLRAMLRTKENVPKTVYGYGKLFGLQKWFILKSGNFYPS